MKKQLGLLLLGLVVVLVAAGQLARAALAPAPNDIEDSLPQWSGDGGRIAFDRTAPSLQHIVTMSSEGKDLFVASFSGRFRGFVPSSGAPPYMLVEDNGATTLTIGGRYAGPRAQLHGVDATASPDGTRAAYLRDGTLYVARIDNLPPNLGVTPSPSVETAVATGIAPSADEVVGPAWSPDGSRVAIAAGSSLVLAAADGSGSRTLVTSVSPISNPSWSHDGATIAYELHAGYWQVWFVGVAGGGARGELFGDGADYRFPQFSPVDSQLAYISDKQHVRGGATRYRYALYTSDTAKLGTTQKLVDDVHPYSPARWSPDGALLAVAAGQECLRWGVYTVHTAGFLRVRRLSNLCRYDGTSAADTIHASPYFDIVNGFGGDDHLYGFWGNDKLLGENGNDTILGDAGSDVIFGGPGDDVIFGGTGDDTIIGGPGHDRIDCGPGNDTVEGAGRLDRIAKNCEHVRR